MIGFLQYSLEAVEAAIARGEEPRFEEAIPSSYDELFLLCQRLGVLDGTG